MASTRVRPHPGPVRTRGRPRIPWAALVGGIGGGLVALAAHRTLIDDAYITLDYARTLAQHGQWGIAPGMPGNTATSPLNVLLLAGLIVVTGGRPVLAAGLLHAAALAVVGLALAALCRRLGWSRWPGIAATALVVVNPMLVSALGMETSVALALLGCLGWALAARRVGLAGVLCGLLVLTRADLAAYALPALAVVLVTRPRQVLGMTGAAVAVALPWFLAAWWWLGSAVPDTFLIKLGEPMGDRTFANGLWFFGLGYPFAVITSLLPAVVGLLVLVRWACAPRRVVPGVAAVRAVWGLGALLHAGTYLVLGSAPYQWYYGPALGTLALLAGFSAGPLRPVRRRAALALAFALVAVVAGYLAFRPWTLTTVTGNWATASEYAALATRAPPGSVVESFGEVGTLAYFCDCRVRDRLADRAEFADLLERRTAEAGPVARWLLELNYRNLRVPPPLVANYEFTFVRDGPGVPATSWRGDQGVMVVRPV